MVVWQTVAWTLVFYSHLWHFIFVVSLWIFYPFSAFPFTCVLLSLFACFSWLVVWNFQNCYTITWCWYALINEGNNKESSKSEDSFGKVKEDNDDEWLQIIDMHSRYVVKMSFNRTYFTIDLVLLLSSKKITC